jgi:hypothetical protein
MLDTDTVADLVRKRTHANDENSDNGNWLAHMVSLANTLSASCLRTPAVGQPLS